jgi:hypothetical protein
MDGISRASWRGRFWAWLIDVLLMGILWSSLMTISTIGASSAEGLGDTGNNALHLLDGT